LISSPFVRAFFVGCSFLVSMVSSAAAAPGDVDRSFGQAGTVSLPNGTVHYATPDDMAIASGGEIYVLRTVQRCPTFSSCTIEHLVTRVHPNGALDSGFGGDGVFVPVDGSLYREDASLALTADARIVVASTDDGDLVLVRLNPDGSRDGGFGVAGIARFDLGVPVDRARVAVQADGRVVVASEPVSGYGGDAVIVVRLTAQGTPDPSFNGGAPFVTSLGSGFGGIGLTGAGGVVLAGPRCCGVDGRAAHLAGLDQTGRLDSSFGRSGELFIDDVGDGVGIGALVVLPKGRIYVVGSGRSKGDAFAIRLLPSGKLDRSFGQLGIAYMRRSFLEVSGAAVDRGGRLLIAGSAPDGSRRPSSGPRRLTVVRRLADGRRDLTFAGGSLVRLRSLGAQVIAAGLQKGHMLVVFAESGSCIRTCPAPRNFLIRYIGGTSGSRCQGHRATIVGTRHGETLTGTRRRDVISALAGNDSVRGLGGDDLICGGRGDDRLRGGKGRDALRGGPGQNDLRR
jgi:uncharacterized delta-60 repeat protein